MPMTTPKEALERALEYLDGDSPMHSRGGHRNEVLRVEIRQALASLEGDAVERVAETAQTFWQGSSGRSWTECCEKLPAQANWFRRLARAILATGLVAGEAAIRADEREKCEHRVEELDCLYINDERCPFGGIPADPETSIRREAIKECLAAIRSGGLA